MSSPVALSASCYSPLVPCRPCGASSRKSRVCGSYTSKSKSLKWRRLRMRKKAKATRTKTRRKTRTRMASSRTTTGSLGATSGPRRRPRAARCPSITLAASTASSSTGWYVTRRDVTCVRGLHDLIQCVCVVTCARRYSVRVTWGSVHDTMWSVCVTWRSRDMTWSVCVTWRSCTWHDVMYTNEVVRIGSIIIFHLSKLWKAEFLILCDEIFLVRLQEKFEIDHSCLQLFRARGGKWQWTTGCRLMKKAWCCCPPRLTSRSSGRCCCPKLSSKPAHWSK